MKRLFLPNKIPRANIYSGSFASFARLIKKEFREAIKKELLSKQPLSYDFGAMAKGDPKSPMDAALLGFFLIGFGHFYLRMWGKGILLILLTILTAAFLRTSYIFMVFFIISPAWAYYDAKSYNREWGYGDFGEKVTIEAVEEADEVTDEGIEGETEQPNFCPNCGKPLLQDDKFCSRCGKGT
jgi:zinc-ribbon domain